MWGDRYIEPSNEDYAALTDEERLHAKRVGHEAEKNALLRSAEILARERVMDEEVLSAQRRQEKFLQDNPEARPLAEATEQAMRAYFDRMEDYMLCRGEFAGPPSIRREE